MVEDAGVRGRVGARGPPDRRLVDVDDLVDLAETVDAVVGAGPKLRLMEAVCHRMVQRLVDQGRLARAGDAGDAAEDAERDGDVDALEVVFASAPHQQRSSRLATPFGHLDLALAGEVLAGERRRVLRDLGRRAGRDHVAAVLAGPRAEVDQMVGCPHGSLVVLDDDDRVAEVAQAVERPDQLRVVALVKPDRRLVEHVHDPDEARPDLRRQPDPLSPPPPESERAERSSDR